MTVVLFISTTTAPLAIQSIKWAALLLGGKFDAKALIVCHASTDPQQTVQALRDLFDGIDVLHSHQVTEDNVFADVKGHFDRQPTLGTWFYWQTDWTLLRTDFKDLMPALAIKPATLFQPQTLPEWIVKLPVFQTTDRTHFDTLKEVHDTVDFRFYFHSGSDGSLIERLKEERNSTSVNVPQHAMEYFEPKIETPPGTVDILIVTYKKDFPWLRYCLKAIRKFGTGFRQVVAAVPRDDYDDLANLTISQYGGKFRIYPYDDVPGKGFVMHAAKICQADLISDADFIMHMDPDCIMKERNDAGHYFMHGLPIMTWRPYESLKGPRLSGVVQDCYMWRSVSEQTLGMPLHAYTMTRHPTVYDRRIYKPFRDRVEEVHGVPFEQWFCKQKNDHPQGVAEFPSLGGFCYERFKHLFTWIDTTVAAPRDLMKAFWSHEGIDQWIGDGWHDGKPVGPNAEKKLTARMLIESWLA